MRWFFFLIRVNIIKCFWCLIFKGSPFEIMPILFGVLRFTFGFQSKMNALRSSIPVAVHFPFVLLFHLSSYLFDIFCLVWILLRTDNVVYRLKCAFIHYITWFLHSFRNTWYYSNIVISFDVVVFIICLCYSVVMHWFFLLRIFG